MPVTGPDGQIMRKNDNKLPLELIPPEAWRALALVLDHGKHKYGARNWELGMPWSVCYGSLQRHLLAWWAGEDYDKESGLSHLSHALANVAFLVTYEMRNRGEDDRPNSAASRLLLASSNDE